MPVRALRAVRDGLLGLAYPADCLVCGRAVESFDDGVACSHCWNALEPGLQSQQICLKCGAPIPEDRRDHDATNAQRCGLCDSLPFSAARAIAIYHGAIEASVLFLKTRPHICPRLRGLIASTFSAHESVLSCDALVPVPLHPSRQRARGFNQASIIAAVIAGRSGVSIDSRSLVRVKETERHRAGLDAIDRARSVERAFDVIRPDRIRTRRILLVDDVFTTGSTLSSATTALLAAGAAEVKVMTIARVFDTRVRS